MCGYSAVQCEGQRDRILECVCEREYIIVMAKFVRGTGLDAYLKKLKVNTWTLFIH